MEKKEALLRIAKCMFRLRQLGRFDGHLVLLRRFSMLFDRVNMYKASGNYNELCAKEVEMLLNKKIAELEAIKEARS